jgi:hypothetical protein
VPASFIEWGDEMPVSQLIISKYLFKKGEEILQEGNPASAGLAVSLFQDSVEIMIWTIAKEVDVELKKYDSFLKIWDPIKDAPKNDKNLSLPLKSKIIELNTSRVGFKHYGNLPALSDGVKFLGYADEFIRETMKSFFNKDFDDLSLADVIKNEYIRKRIKVAEKYLLDDDFKNCLINCAEAELLSTKEIKLLIPKADSSLSDAGILFGIEKAPQGRQVFRYISDYLNSLREALIVSIIGNKIIDYLKFKNIIPSVIEMGDGSFRSRFRRTKTSAEEAKFCVDFVTKYAINV